MIMFFQALCKQLTKLHESTDDVWPAEQTARLFAQVHGKILASVERELVRGRAMAYDSAASRLEIIKKITSRSVPPNFQTKNDAK